MREESCSCGHRQCKISILCEMNKSIGDPLSFFHSLLFSVLLFSPSPPRLPSLRPWQERVCSGLHSAGNRRTLHTWAAHLTHTYESLKLKTHKHTHMDISALDQLSRKNIITKAWTQYGVPIQRGHLADKNMCKHTSCRLVCVKTDPSFWLNDQRPEQNVQYLWTGTHPFLHSLSSLTL